MAVLVAPLLRLLVVEGTASQAPQAATVALRKFNGGLRQLLCRQQRRRLIALAQRAAMVRVLRSCGQAAAMVPGRCDGVGAAAQ